MGSPRMGRSILTGPNDLITATHEDVDTGETRTFPPHERCIAPRPACDRGVLEALHFEVAFFRRTAPFLGIRFCRDAPDDYHAARRGGKCEPI
jgi:hypothetical protein